MNMNLANPRLSVASSALLETIKELRDGTAEKDTAKIIISASNAVVNIEAQDLKGRLASAKVAAIEAKLIDAKPAQSALAAA